MKTVELYTPSHFFQLRQWYLARNLIPPSEKVLPPTGAVVPGVAAGFLYLTDGPFVIVEGLVSNPRASKRDRKAAISAVLRRLFELARGQGFTHAIGFSQRGVVVEHSRRLGVQAEPSYHLLFKDL